VKIAVYQILTPLLSLIMIVKAISDFRRGERTIREFLVFLFFWSGVSAVAIFPDFFVTNFEKITGFKSGITGILFLTILILGFLVLYLLKENENRTHEINEIVRKMALKDEMKN
jgi:hypothetical protein